MKLIGDEFDGIASPARITTRLYLGIVRLPMELQIVV